MSTPVALTWKVAAQILERVDTARAHISNELAKASRNSRINFPLLERLVKGSLSKRSALDRELSRELKTNLGSLPPFERQIARVAAFELFEASPADRPRIIAIARSLLKDSQHEPLKKALMVALNRLSPARGGPPAGGNDATPRALAEELGYPAWLLTRWVSQLGKTEAIAFCQANNQPWGTHVRCNTLKTSVAKLIRALEAEGIASEPGRFDRDTLYLKRLPRGTRLPDLSTFRRGLFQVQDESATLIGRLVAPKRGELILDVCAAPGGKATHLAALMKNDGRILAVDAEARRLRKVKENCKRLGITIVRTQAADATRLRLPQPADRILLDAPCSGFGVLGRKSDIRWNKTEADIRSLVKIQARLLDHAASLVRPGGTLVYSTCTIEPAENEDRVAEFLKDHPEFELSAPPPGFPAELVSGKFFRSWPHRHGMGGAFGAVLLRRL